MRARHSNKNTVTFMPSADSSGSEAVIEDCACLNSIYLHDDPVWLELLRKRKLRSIRTFACIKRSRAATHTERWVLTLFDLRSDLRDARLEEFKASVAAMRRPPRMGIRDWASEKAKNGERSITWRYA
jgi:hypothetical protein